MFVADAWLTLALLAVVGGAAAAIGYLSAPPLAGGAALTAGTLAVLLISVRSAAAKSPDDPGRQSRPWKSMKPRSAASASR